MWTFLKVKAALLPLTIFALGVAAGSPLLGSTLALAYGVAGALYRYRGAIPPPFESAFLLGLAIGLVAHVVGPVAVSANSNAVALAGLAIGAALSVVKGAPWTAVFAAGEYGGAAQSPLFIRINQLISGLWAVLFAWIAVAAFLHLPGWASYGPAIVGGIASIVLPRVLVRRSLAVLAAGDRRNAWTPPSFTAAPVESDTSEACDVAVVGAGIGGLTAAAYLADAGLKVHVYEHHVVPGGFAHTWLRRARVRDALSGDKLVFRFDSGVHDVSGWHPGGTVRSVFERFGIADAAEWLRLDHRYVLDGKTLDVPRDWRAYADALAGFYPHAAAGIRALFEDIHTLYVAMFSTARERGGIPGASQDPDALLAFARANPLAIAWMQRPWTEFVARHVTDAGALKWISALSGYVTDDKAGATVADIVPLYGYYFNGGYYPKGGSGVMADLLVTAIEQRGGKVFLRSPVTRIVTRDGVATGLVYRTPRGEAREVTARAVVCNADARELVDRLLDDGGAAARTLAAQAGPLRTACSAVGVNLGIRGPLDLPPVVHVETPEGPIGIVIASAVDPTAAPDGYATIELLELVSDAEARTWFTEPEAAASTDLSALRQSDAYLARKQAVGDRLIARAAYAIPDLASRIVYRSEASPLTFQRYSWTRHGSIYGTAGRLPTKTPVRNLVLAGAATHGPGIEAVVISGAYAAEALVPGLLADRTKRVTPGAAARPQLALTA